MKKLENDASEYSAEPYGHMHVAMHKCVVMHNYMVPH